MHLEICIPAFNEAPIIASSARAVVEVLRTLPVEGSVVVANNGSTDVTAENALRVEKVTVLDIRERGKGAAVVAAARATKAEVFGFIDSDLSAAPEDITALFEKIQSGKYDIAIGSRLADTDLVDRNSLRTLSSQLFNQLRKFIVGIDVLDSQCGLKLMNQRGRQVLASCQEKGWFFDIEFLARSERAGLRIVEVPVHWNEFRYPDRKSKLSFFHHGFGALAALVRIRRALKKAQ